MVSIAVSGDTIEENAATALEADLTIPTGVDAKGIVLFAHGSGSSRHSPRNKYVADIYKKMDLLLY